MSGVWDGPVPKHLFAGGVKYGPVRRVVATGRVLRRVEIEDYFIEHESWGSAPRKKYHLTITIDGEGPFPAWASIPGPWYESIDRDLKHTCPLTEAKPGEVMMYACPYCSGATC